MKCASTPTIPALVPQFDEKIRPFIDNDANECPNLIKLCESPTFSYTSSANVVSYSTHGCTLPSQDCDTGHRMYLRRFAFRTLDAVQRAIVGPSPIRIFPIVMFAVEVCDASRIPKILIPKLYRKWWAPNRFYQQEREEGCEEQGKWVITHSPSTKPSLINSHCPVGLVERKHRSRLIFQSARTIIHHVPIKEIPCLTTCRYTGKRLFRGVVVKIKGQAAVRDGKMGRGRKDDWVVISEVREEEMTWAWGCVGAVWTGLSVAETGEGEGEYCEPQHGLSNCPAIWSVFWSIEDEFGCHFLERAVRQNVEILIC